MFKFSLSQETFVGNCQLRHTPRAVNYFDIGKLRLHQ